MGWPIDPEEYDGERLFGYVDDPSEKDQTPEPKQTPKVIAAQQLLDWIQNDPTRVSITALEIRQFGPRALRNKEIAIEAAEVLAKAGWLVSTETSRRDSYKWQIVRKPILQPTLASIAAK
jgi:hypothetical protein